MDTKEVFETESFLHNFNPLILVVEDDEDNQLLLKYAIAMFGWKYVLAVDAIGAITTAQERHPDLILLDIVMPDIDGLQVANLLKSHIQTKRIPLIAVTGLVGKEKEELILSSGFDGYLSKPYNLDDLQKVIFSTVCNQNRALHLNGMVEADKGTGGLGDWETGRLGDEGKNYVFDSESSQNCATSKIVI